MIADLPQDIQSHVWDIFTESLHERQRQHERQVLFDRIDSLCDHDTAAREYLLDWMAHMVQFPHHKPAKAVVLVGHCHRSKDFLITVLTRLVPTLHTSDPRRDVYGKQNGLMEGTRLVVIEDAKRLHIPDLKSLISDSDIVIRERGRGDRLVPSSHRVVLTIDTMRAGFDKRRFFPIHCSPVPSDCVSLDLVRELLLSRPVEP